MAGNIVVAWVLTLPAAGFLGAITYTVTSLFGTGAAGPIVITAVMLIALTATFARRLQQATPAPSTP